MLCKEDMSSSRALRISETYCRLGNLIGPLVTYIKALSGRSCELASVNELEVYIEEKDKELTNVKNQLRDALLSKDDAKKGHLKFKRNQEETRKELENELLSWKYKVEELERSLKDCQSKIGKPTYGDIRQILKDHSKVEEEEDGEEFHFNHIWVE